MANKQKKTVNTTTTISFSYHKLEIRVVSCVASVVALPIFEADDCRQHRRGDGKALEEAIISGSGAGQPRGIVNHSVPAARTVSLAPSEFGQYTTWRQRIREDAAELPAGVCLS